MYEATGFVKKHDEPPNIMVIFVKKSDRSESPTMLKMKDMANCYRDGDDAILCEGTLKIWLVYRRDV